jgi:hypothetical protein
MSTRCQCRARHWRIAFGTVGLRTPVCVYCGSPNPRPLADWEWDDLIGWSQDHNVGDHARSAIEARQAADLPQPSH